MQQPEGQTPNSMFLKFIIYNIKCLTGGGRRDDVTTAGSQPKAWTLTELPGLKGRLRLP